MSSFKAGHLREIVQIDGGGQISISIIASFGAGCCPLEFALRISKLIPAECKSQQRAAKLSARSQVDSGSADAARRFSFGQNTILWEEAFDDNDVRQSKLDFAG